MTDRHQRVDFGMSDEIDFPIDWEIFSRGPIVRRPAPVACGEIAAPDRRG